MVKFLFALIIIISSYYTSFQKNINVENLFSENEVKSQNYTNLKEWLNQLVIEIPNDLLENITQGIVEDLTIYGIGLDNILTTNPEILENKRGLNISLANAHINIMGIFTLFSFKRAFIAHISNLNALLPLYLIRDPVTGLVKDVNTNGLNIDFDNLEIEIELGIPEILKIF